MKTKDIYNNNELQKLYDQVKDIPILVQQVNELRALNNELSFNGTLQKKLKDEAVNEKITVIEQYINMLRNQLSEIYNNDTVYLANNQQLNNLYLFLNDLLQ